MHTRIGYIAGIIAVSTLTTSLILGAALYANQDALRAWLGTEDGEIEREPVHVATEVGSVADMVERTIPAVVSIVITAEVPIIERYYEDYSTPFDRFFGRPFGFEVPRERQIGTEKREIGGGSGFFVSQDGYIVTNRHVVDSDDVGYSVVTNDGDTYDVEVVAKDTTFDIAILKVDAEREFPYLTFADAETLRLGEPVIAIGNALAQFPNSVSVGVVSGLSRSIVAGDYFSSFEPLEGLIQTDAAINRGNSGGPLLSAKGEVIGVNVAVAGNGENIGFAIPADQVASIFESVAEHGTIVRPYLGVRYIDITEEIAQRNGLTVEYGALVVRGETPADLAVVPSSPADKAGIEENDIILAVDGTELDGSVSLARLIREYRVGDTVTMRVLHDGEEHEVSVVLESAPTD